MEIPQLQTWYSVLLALAVIEVGWRLICLLFEYVLLVLELETPMEKLRREKRERDAVVAERKAKAIERREAAAKAATMAKEAELEAERAAKIRRDEYDLRETRCLAALQAAKEHLSEAKEALSKAEEKEEATAEREEALEQEKNELAERLAVLEVVERENERAAHVATLKRPAIASTISRIHFHSCAINVKALTSSTAHSSASCTAATHPSATAHASIPSRKSSTGTHPSISRKTRTTKTRRTAQSKSSSIRA